MSGERGPRRGMEKRFPFVMEAFPLPARVE